MPKATAVSEPMIAAMMGSLARRGCAECLQRVSEARTL
jgi:hypothetical protein